MLWAAALEASPLPAPPAGGRRRWGRRALCTAHRRLSDSPQTHRRGGAAPKDAARAHRVHSQRVSAKAGCVRPGHRGGCLRSLTSYRRTITRPLEGAGGAALPSGGGPCDLAGTRRLASDRRRSVLPLLTGRDSGAKGGSGRRASRPRAEHCLLRPGYRPAESILFEGTRL